MEQYLNAMSGKNYANFKGRSRRQEFWMFNLFYFLISVICIIIDVQIFEFSIDDQFAPLYTICSLIHLIPSLAVTVRRLSRRWILWAFYFNCYFINICFFNWSYLGFCNLC